MIRPDTDVESRLDAAIDHAVPDVLAEILSRCDEDQSAEIIPIAAAKKSRSGAKRLVSIAAAAALIIGITFGFSEYQAAYAVESVVTLGEGENAVALKLNKKDKVVAVESAEGASEAVDGLELEGLAVSDAITRLTDALAESGLIDDAVSVEGGSEKTKDELYTLVTATVTEAITKAAGLAGEKAGDAVDALTEGDIGGAIGTVGEAVGDVIGEAGGIVGDVVGEAGGLVGDVIGGVADGAGDITESAAKGAGDIVNTVTSGLDSLLSGIADWFSGNKE